MDSNDTGKLIVLAIGGNSLIRDKSHQTVQDQYDAARETCASIAPLLRRGHRVVVTHGNGPQVGFILRRAELAAGELHMVPLDSCGADTQGAIGYQLQRALRNELRGWDDAPTPATVVTQTLVDAGDPAFRAPTKPIGGFMDEETARTRSEEAGWHVVEDAGRGWRRVVASPRPVEILELPIIRVLVERGFAVIAVGGGGIPVVRDEHGEIAGAEAVIDKDLATSLLARQLDADVLLISTAVDKAFLDFGKPTQRPIDRMTVAEARRYLDEGHFAPGSMAPKIQALVEFLEAGGREAYISLPGNLLDAVEGRKGTRITP